MTDKNIGIPYAPVVDFNRHDTPIVECPECGDKVVDAVYAPHGTVLWSGYADHYANTHNR